MNKAVKTVIVIVILAIVVGTALVIFTPDKSNAPSTNPPASSSSDAPTPEGEEIAATITYDGNTFSQSADSVKSGDRVEIANNSDEELQFDSDPHPVHTDNSELNVDEVGPGQKKTFVLTKKGTWGYHNHLNSSQSGEITVE